MAVLHKSISATPQPFSYSYHPFAVSGAQSVCKDWAGELGGGQGGYRPSSGGGVKPGSCERREASARSDPCLEPRDFQSAREKASMSGEQTTARSASPQTSPKTPAGTGTSPYQTGLRGGGDRQAENRALESAGIPRSSGDTSQQQSQQAIPHRPLDVQTILNPAAENQLPFPGARNEGSGPSPKALDSSPRVQPPFPFQGTGVGHGQTTPTATPGPPEQPSTAPSSAERCSPGTARPLPAIAAARRVLTPRTPRLISPGQPAFRTLNPPQPQPQHFPVAPQDANRVILPDAGAHIRPDQQPHSARGSPLVQQQFSRVVSPAGRPPSGIAPLPVTTRSVSQPIQSQPPPPHLRGGPIFGPGGQGVPPRQPPPGYPPHNSYNNVMPPTSNGYPGPTVDARWVGSGAENPLQYAQGGARSFAFAEGQAALRIQPAHGEEFIVPVDTHQGSRQADEKRQRNAGASARFRKRKKDRETMERMEHQRMENQYRELEAQIRALETDRDRIRADRDRLRDLVYRTPDISELAYQGPPSPVSSIGSAAAASSAARAVGGGGSVYGASDPETGERASQRRRTDPHPQVEFSPASYTSTPGSLPSIPSTGYPASISHPGTPSMRSQPPQLPPLRLGSTTGTPTTVVSAANTPIQAYQTIKREPYETGWATGARGSAEPSHRGGAGGPPEQR